MFQDPQVQKHATQILRKMLEQEEAELKVRHLTHKPICSSCHTGHTAECGDTSADNQNPTHSQDLMVEQSKNPSPSLEERIESAKRRAHQVRVKIQRDLVRCDRRAHIAVVSAHVQVSVMMLLLCGSC